MLPDKFVYCPSQEFIDDAKKLSSEYLLPIVSDNIGEKFSWVDKSCASVVFSTNKQEFIVRKKITTNIPFVISLFDEQSLFEDILVKFEHIDSGKIEEFSEPSILEKNYFYMSPKLAMPGKWRIFVFINGNLFESEVVEVSNAT
jgi:hypothetical protein